MGVTKVMARAQWPVDITITYNEATLKDCLHRKGFIQRNITTINASFYVLIISYYKVYNCKLYQ